MAWLRAVLREEGHRTRASSSGKVRTIIILVMAMEVATQYVCAHVCTRACVCTCDHARMQAAQEVGV